MDDDWHALFAHFRGNKLRVRPNMPGSPPYVHPYHRRYRLLRCFFATDDIGGRSVQVFVFVVFIPRIIRKAANEAVSVALDDHILATASAVIVLVFGRSVRMVRTAAPLAQIPRLNHVASNFSYKSTSRISV